MRSLVVVTAEPAGWGPAGIMGTITRELAEAYSIVVLGRATVADFATRNGLALVEYDGEGEQHSVVDALREASVVVSFGNWELAATVSKHAKRSLYFDMMFFYWTSNVWKHVDTDAYLCQNFPGVPERIAELGLRFRGPVEVVGPVVDLGFRRAADPDNAQIIIALGGLESDVKGYRIAMGSEFGYPLAVARAFVPAIRAATDLKIVVAASPRIRDGLLDDLRMDHPEVEVASLSHAEFLNRLPDAVAVLTTGGVGVTYECCAYGVPAFFLPPANMSQHVQIKEFREAGIARYRLGWEDVTGRDVFRPQGDAAAQLKYDYDRIRDCTRPARWDGSASSAVETAVTAIMDVVLAPEEQRRVQERFITALGGNGVNAVVRRIRRLADGS